MSSSFPVTNGYTINLIRTSKSQSKNQFVVKTGGGLDKNTTFFVNCSDPEQVIEEVAEEVLQHEQGEFFIADIAQEELIYDATEVVAEEVVDSESMEVIKDQRSSLEQNKTVFCDICQTHLSSAMEAVEHMHGQHGILTYQGPLFQCDFCGPLVLVTDRVTHMKKTHYLPLEAGFSRTDSQYNCLSCTYKSDQLTNIRNHVDAKHTTGTTSYKCAVCQTVYKTLNSLRAHKSRVHGKKRKLQHLKTNPDSEIKHRRREAHLEVGIRESPECNTEPVFTTF